jgi:hypothetical protein
MLAGQQAAARERQDRAAMAALGQQHRDVDHAEPTALHQHGVRRIDRGRGSPRPWVGDQPRAGAVLGARRGRQPRRQVADAENREVGRARAAVGERQLHAALLLGQPDHAVADPAQRDVGRRRGLRAVQKVAQVAPVDAARDEGMARRRDRCRRMLGQVVRPEPAQEVGRIGREGADVVVRPDRGRGDLRARAGVRRPLAGGDRRRVFRSSRSWRAAKATPGPKVADWSNNRISMGDGPLCSSSIASWQPLKPAPMIAIRMVQPPWRGYSPDWAQAGWSPDRYTTILVDKME